eukprot:1186850-Prorocentrum_minimum.AAC.3
MAPQTIVDHIKSHEAQFPAFPGDRLFYLALPPVTYPAVCEYLKSYAVSTTGWTRIVVEKPFGRDLQSSEALNEQICCLFECAPVPILLSHLCI